MDGITGVILTIITLGIYGSLRANKRLDKLETKVDTIITLLEGGR